MGSAPGGARCRLSHRLGRHTAHDTAAASPTHAKNGARQRFVRGPLGFLILVLVVRSSFDLAAPTLEARAWFEAQTLLIPARTYLVAKGSGQWTKRVASPRIEEMVDKASQRALNNPSKG